MEDIGNTLSIEAWQEGSGERAQIGNANIGHHRGIRGCETEREGGTIWVTEQVARQSGIDYGRSHQALVPNVQGTS
jgi:hypothetical protein